MQNQYSVSSGAKNGERKQSAAKRYCFSTIVGRFLLS